MDELTIEQFLENVKAWKPKEDFEARVAERLRSGQTPEEMVAEISHAFQAFSKSTYQYIEYINELSAFKELDRKNLLTQVAHLVGLVQAMKEGGRQFEEIFKKYDSAVRPQLTKDRFDTVYYDAIQGMDIREMLKKIIDEVEVILQSFSLVATDLSGVQCMDLYESSIRYHLFLQYLLAKKSFSKEELWSVLFDVYNEISQMQMVDLEPTEEELVDLEAKIKKYKTN
ncbi:MAG TPA: hypothetical protein VIJ93_07155 [bacterium]